MIKLGSLVFYYGISREHSKIPSLGIITKSGNNNCICYWLFQNHQAMKDEEEWSLADQEYVLNQRRDWHIIEPE